VCITVAPGFRRWAHTSAASCAADDEGRAHTRPYKSLETHILAVWADKWSSHAPGPGMQPVTGCWGLAFPAPVAATCMLRCELLLYCGRTAVFTPSPGHAAGECIASPCQYWCLPALAQGHARTVHVPLDGYSTDSREHMPACQNLGSVLRSCCLAAGTFVPQGP
jgi:hypothetical protein